MGKIHSVQLNIDHCLKEISVFCDDVTAFPLTIDILTTSASVGSYSPTPRTVLHALHQAGIYIYKLALSPEFDLRNPCHVWLSKAVGRSKTNIRRIGCIELVGHHLSKLEQNGIKAWYAPRDGQGPYAEAITNAIDHSHYFIVILVKTAWPLNMF